jgi:hypothetical protein
MFYGLETLLPSGKSFETLGKQYKKIMILWQRENYI